jgi:hypothetical protein
VQTTIIGRDSGHEAPAWSITSRPLKGPTPPPAPPSPRRSDELAAFGAQIAVGDLRDFEVTERGVQVIIASPDGGRVEFDGLSDPRDPSRWSA